MHGSRIDKSEKATNTKSVNGKKRLGVYSHRKVLKFKAQECHFPHSEHPNI
jgi:hypothetical protein